MPVRVNLSFVHVPKRIDPHSALRQEPVARIQACSVGLQVARQSAGLCEHNSAYQLQFSGDEQRVHIFRIELEQSRPNIYFRGRDLQRNAPRIR